MFEDVFIGPVISVGKDLQVDMGLLVADIVDAVEDRGFIGSEVSPTITAEVAANHDRDVGQFIDHQLWCVLLGSHDLENFLTSLGAHPRGIV